MNPEVLKYLQEIGRKGGEVSTPAKRRTARENGKKGGRLILRVMTHGMGDTLLK